MDTHAQGEPGSGGSIVLLVTGNITVGDRGTFMFVQNFFLAPAPMREGEKKQASFFVLNDTFRLLGGAPASSSSSSASSWGKPAAKEAPTIASTG